MRLASIGMIEELAGMDRKVLKKVTNFIGETFSQLCLAAQKLHPIDVKKYEPRSSVTKLDN